MMVNVKQAAVELELVRGLLHLHDKHPDWYFTTRRTKPSGTSGQILNGRLNSWLSTTFWGFPLEGDDQGEPIVGLWFRYQKEVYKYLIEFRLNSWISDKDKQPYTALSDMLASEGSPFYGRANKKTNKHDTSIIAVSPLNTSYPSIQEMIKDVERDLIAFLPFVDEEVRNLKRQYPHFGMYRLTDADYSKVRLRIRSSSLGSSPMPTPDNSTQLSRKPQMPSPLNEILYGPPGTGKTYSTITRAVAIVENKHLEAVADEDRQEVLHRFRGYQESGRIAFTTFHQSLSYEDFVEGLKPVLGDEDETDDGQVRYTIKRGMFRNACDAALRSVLKKRPSESTRTVLDFDRKYELLAERVAAQLLETDEYKLESRNGGIVLVDDISTQGNFRIKHENGSRVYTVGKERLTRLHLGLLERGSEVSNIHDTFRDIIGGSNSSAYWAVLNAVRKFEPERTTHEIEVETMPSKDALATLTRDDYRQPDLDRHVLIIDEINRGNVSAILGELITLLEPNKRLGAKEELKVTLPYSRDTFGVPPNLHLIGTMNTADRSVEALDAALRRRFVFREVKPDSGVIQNVLGENVAIKVTDKLTVDLAELLDLLNQRIAVLRDTDHQLGHSYFLDTEDWQGLRDVLVDRIVPLLREYFFADPGQLQLVVGNGFCQRMAANAAQFGTTDDMDALKMDNLYTYTFPNPAEREELAKFIIAMNYSA